MNNITYNIVENSSESEWKELSLTHKRSIDEINIGLDTKIDTEIDINSERCAREIDYDLNYNFKYLTNILEFYGIKKHKLNKKVIIERIIEFEMNIDNLNTVEIRKRLFDNFIELKNDKYFSKYIMGGLN